MPENGCKVIRTKSLWNIALSRPVQEVPDWLIREQRK